MADSPGWTIRPAARADLSAIWLEGAANWGPDHAGRHTDGLFALFDLLAAFPAMARERPEFVPPVRIHPSGAHLVIYRQAGPGVEIIRILHARQDLLAALQEG